MNDFINNSGIIANYYNDSNNNPIVKVVEETQKVNPLSNTIQLLEIPSPTSSVVILNKSMIRVWNKDDVVNSNHYYVDEQNGFIHFHPSQATSQTSLKYGSIGCVMLSAGRIYTDLDSNGNVTQTLQDIIANGYAAIEAISTLGDATVIILQLKEDIKTARDLHEILDRDIQLGTPLSNDLSANVPLAQQVDVSLKEIVPQAITVNTALATNIDEGEIVGTHLQEIIDSAANINNLVLSTDNKNFTITSSQWVLQGDGKYAYEWNHTLNSQNLMFSAYEITSNGKESISVKYIMVSNSRVKFISDTKKDIIIIASGKYYGGVVATLSTFTTDDLIEGINNKYCKYVLISIPSASFVVSADGLYDATVTHNLNTSKFINKTLYYGDKEVLCDIQKVDSNKLTITVDEQNNYTLVLCYGSGM